MKIFQFLPPGSATYQYFTEEAAKAAEERGIKLTPANFEIQEAFPEADGFTLNLTWNFNYNGYGTAKDNRNGSVRYMDFRTKEEALKFMENLGIYEPEQILELNQKGSFTYRPNNATYHTGQLTPKFGTLGAPKTRRTVRTRLAG